MELFIDLFYVGIIAINGSIVAQNPTGSQLHIFALTFMYSCHRLLLNNSPSWRIWTDMRDLISTFDTDDVAQRMGILFILACLLGFTINMSDALESTLTMIVESSPCQSSKVDCVLCYSSVVHCGIAFNIRVLNTVCETYSICVVCRYDNGCFCLDWKYIC
jgi:Bacterial low temperature requirement A protein (LtrA)